jgi:hypothetical protein
MARIYEHLTGWKFPAGHEREIRRHVHFTGITQERWIEIQKILRSTVKRLRKIEPIVNKLVLIEEADVDVTTRPAAVVNGIPSLFQLVETRMRISQRTSDIIKKLARGPGQSKKEYRLLAEKRPDLPPGKLTDLFFPQAKGIERRSHVAGFRTAKANMKR